MTGLLAVKLWRDLRATWPRLLLMVIAIAVSLTAFSAVLYAWSVIGRETEQAYLSTEPASATIRLFPAIDADEAIAIAAEARTRPGVIGATGRAQFTSEVEVDGRVLPVPLQLFVAAPNDPLRLARFYPDLQQGNWPPAAGEVFIRRDSLGLLQVALGDTVTVETPDGKPARLRVAGTVYDPSLAPAPQQQTAQGYVTTASLAALGEPDVIDQLKIQVSEPGQAVPSRNRAAIVAVASEVADWLQRENGLAIREIQVPKPYAHPHQGQADALLSALLVGAGAALLFSTILVANMLNGLFTQQIPQIGIMKAIGARSGDIARLYLLMTLLVSTAATFLALAPGILLSRAFAPNVLAFLGIQPASVAAAWWTYLAVLAVGLGLPPLMALLPLLRTSRTTVRAAIDYHGVPSTSVVAGFLVRLGSIRWLDRGLIMALRNTVRRPARFVLSVGLLASAGTVFVAAMSARDGLAAVGEEASDRLRWDVNVRLANSASVAPLASLLESVPGVCRVEGWTIVSAGIGGPGQIPFTRTYPDQSHGGVFVTAVPADTTMLVLPKLREGRWLEPREPGAIVLSQVSLANTDLDVHAGDTIALVINGDSVNWRVVGIAEERGDAGGAYVTAEGLAEALGQPLWSNTLRIATASHDEQSRAAIARIVDEQLTGAGVEVQSSESVGLREASTAGHLEPILVILLATALPMGAIGCIGLASTMGANILDRTREFGVMHAIGARPERVRGIVTAEGIFIALATRASRITVREALAYL